MSNLTGSSATNEDTVGVQQHPGTAIRIHIDSLLEEKFGTPRISADTEETQRATLEVCEEPEARKVAVDFTEDVDAERTEGRRVVLGPEQGKNICVGI